MDIEIIDLSDDKILVNDKLVYIDLDGNCIAKIELTQSEYKALNKHLFSTRRNNETT